LSGGKVPWLSLGALLLIWVVIAIQPQMEQQRFATHAALVEEQDYAGALAYMAKHQQADFPPGRRLEPNPYEYRVWQDLPPTIALLTPQTSPWIRQVYLHHLTEMLSHYFPRYDSLKDVADMWLAIEQLPEGREWVLKNQNALAKQGRRLGYGQSETKGESTLHTNILSTLRRMGMTEDNLSRLEK
jgi:hypothetical protein